MGLKVIGAGLGRTGTASLKIALEQLGFGPCYHMGEVLPHVEERVPQWVAAARGNPDWDAIFKDITVRQIILPVRSGVNSQRIFPMPKLSCLCVLRKAGSNP